MTEIWTGISGPGALRAQIAAHKTAVERALNGATPEAQIIIPPAGQPPAELGDGETAFTYACPPNAVLPPPPAGVTVLTPGVARLGQALLQPPPVPAPKPEAPLA